LGAARAEANSIIGARLGQFHRCSAAATFLGTASMAWRLVIQRKWEFRERDIFKSNQRMAKRQCAMAGSITGR
jgi:hypothetical protein